MSVAFSIGWWWIVNYLVAGVVLWLPITYVTISSVRPRRTLVESVREWHRLNGTRFVIAAVVVQVVAWPAFLVDAATGR